MALKIIGSGFGRTGTMTTKTALEQLGFGPCHHMIEVIENPAQAAFWKALAAGKTVDLADVFAGYNAQVDWPGARIYQESSIAFPDAKVIHTERPAEDWWNSFSGTIGKFFRLAPTMPLPPHIADIFTTMSGYLMAHHFADFTDKASTIAAYNRHNQKVRDTIASDRLLVLNVAQGWDPLCRFLGVPVPATPFPRLNPKVEFWEHFGGEPAEAVAAKNEAAAV